jgi:hypothetical protein
MNEVTDTTFDREVLKNLIESSPLSFKENEGSFIFDCPRCSKKDKLWIRKRDGRFVCFYCAEIDNFKGRPEYALKELLGLPLDVIKTKLYGEAWHQDGTGCLNLVFRDPDEEEDPDEEPILKEIAWPTDTYEITNAHSAKGSAYLASRGLPADIAADYGIHYWSAKRRVLFPVVIHGALVGYQARAIYPTEWVDRVTGLTKTAPKIVTSDGLERDKALMFHDRLAGSEHAVLCEGPMDAIKAHLCGGNVAAMGKIVSRGQLLALRRMGIKKVYLALDPDAADEASRIAKELGDLELYLMEPPAGFKDLGDMSMEAVRGVFLTAPKITSNRLFVFLRPPVIT